MASEEIGFDGVAKRCGDGPQGNALLEELEALGDLGGGVEVEESAVVLSQRGEADVVASAGCVFCR